MEEKKRINKIITQLPAHQHFLSMMEIAEAKRKLRKSVIKFCHMPRAAFRLGFFFRAHE